MSKYTFQVIRRFTFLCVISILLISCESAQQTGSAQLDKENVEARKSADFLIFVGRAVCSECHREQENLWKGSHHDLAMQTPSDSTVLGDFNGTQITVFGITSTFYKEGDDFIVRTEGEDGQLHDYKIAYTFGVSPLQQYLVAFPGGRYQTLPLCWDTRPETQGGQRWFHIYQGEQIKPNDMLFWTRVNQNWNYMCAECHSTNVRKNYDFQTDSFKTTYSEIDVSCEACHGPGSEHVDWARQYEKEQRVTTEGDKGLRIRLKDLNKRTWIFTDMEKGNAERTVPLSSNVMVEMCGRCHARRAVLTDDYIYGRELLQTHRVPPLSDELYFADGQIKEEVYVYGSFLQSKMYQKGVICSDCHEPHSTKVYAQDNSLCFRCHLKQKYDSYDHHFHKVNDKGGRCVDCHMPESTYMVIDPRRDHSIRLPRPDISLITDSPNACNKCHPDKTNRWSADYVRKWYGNNYIEKYHYGKTFFEARQSQPKVGKDLLDIILDATQPVMVRATALSLMPTYMDRKSFTIVRPYLYDSNPLIRLYAIQALESVVPLERFSLIRPLIEDPVKTVRLQAVYNLSQVSPSAMTGFDKAAFNEALQEYFDTQKYNGDRPSANVNLGNIYLRDGQLNLAEKMYHRAIGLDSSYVYAYINLADLYRQQNRNSEAEKLLQKAVAFNRPSADLYQALGLAQTRLKKREQAVESLRKAAEIDADNSQIGYYYALSLMEINQVTKALHILEKNHLMNPYSAETLVALATIYRDQQNYQKALYYVDKLIDLAPDNRQYEQLKNQIRHLNNRSD